MPRGPAAPNLCYVAHEFQRRYWTKRAKRTNILGAAGGPIRRAVSHRATWVLSYSLNSTSPEDLLVHPPNLDNKTEESKQILIFQHS
jgi:hypothetical protein